MAESARFSAFWESVPRWKVPVRLLVAVGLGGVIALAQEDGQRAGAVLALAGFILAFRAAQHLSARQAALFGWALGLGFFAVTLRWIIEPFYVDPDRHGWMAPFALAGMGGGLALFWAAAFGLAAWRARGFGARLLLLVGAFGLAELARSHVLTGFPWGLQSYALIGGPFDHLLAWIGPHASSLVLIGLAAGAAYAFHRGWTLIWPGFAVVAFAILGLGLLTPAAPRAAADAPLIRVIQPNADQARKWDPTWMPVFFQRSLALTRADTPPALVIWPETSVPTLLNFADDLLVEIGLAGRGAPVVVGAQRFVPDAGYHNSLALVEPDGTLAALYDKRHLVPFGEYVPFAALLGRIGFTGVADPNAGFAPGQLLGSFDLPGLGRVRVLICYEGIFPQQIIEAGDRPEALVIITNDAWFGAGPGPRQHLVQARARAIEQGLPVVRSANTGISAVIDARGRVLASLPLGQEGFLDHAVPPPLPPTLYARTGDWPAWGALLVLLLGGLIVARRFGVDDAGRAG